MSALLLPIVPSWTRFRSKQQATQGHGMRGVRTVGGLGGFRLHLHFLMARMWRSVMAVMQASRGQIVRKTLEFRQMVLLGNLASGVGKECGRRESGEGWNPARVRRYCMVTLLVGTIW